MRPELVTRMTKIGNAKDDLASKHASNKAQPSEPLCTDEPGLKASTEFNLEELDRLLGRCALSNSNEPFSRPNEFGALQFYSTFIEHSPISFLSFSSTGVIHFVNVAAARLLELDRHELLGRQFSSFVAESDRVQFSSLLSKCSLRGEKQISELKLVALTGTVRQVRVEASAMPDSQDCSVAVFDITDCKSKERAREMRERAIQSVNQAIVITDASQVGAPIVFTNDGFERLTGYSTWQANGRGIDLLVGKKTDLASIAALEAAIVDCVPYATEVWLYRKNKSPFRCSLNFAPVCDESGMPRNYIGFLTDVTERHHAEEQLRHAQKMEAIGQLSGGIAHGFNNLLTVIEGYSDLLIDAPEHFADRSKEFLNEIRTATMRATELTQQLLALGRRQLLQATSFSLNVLVREVTDRLNYAHIKLEVALDPRLHQIWADRSQIAQILMKLIHNATDALVEGGRLTVSTKSIELNALDVASMSNIRPGKYALLSVSDTGCGMTDEVRSRAFEPFFTTKPTGKGTGLGLSAVHGVVTQSGGHIDVSSRAGSGTCFNLYLPQENMNPQSASNANETVVPNGGSETILLVEDEDAVRNIVRIVLVRYGYKVLEAVDGTAALKIAQEYDQTIDMLITDVVMPGLQGPEVARAVVHKIPSIRVIFMSGYVDDARTREGLADATSSFIQKPFSSDELAHKVRAVLDA